MNSAQNLPVDQWKEILLQEDSKWDRARRDYLAAFELLKNMKDDLSTVLDISSRITTEKQIESLQVNLTDTNQRNEELHSELFKANHCTRQKGSVLG